MQPMRSRDDMAEQYSIDKAERLAMLAINRMYRAFAEDIVQTDIDIALRNFGVSEQRRLYRAFMQAYAAGIVEANRLIRKHAPKRVFAAEWAGEATPLEDDPYIAEYSSEAIMSLRDIGIADRKEIRWRMMHALERGASIEHTTDDLLKYFDGDRIRANRFARTATSDIYNRATLHRYEDSGVVGGVQYAAHIDNRTSDICRVLNRTIWAINDPGIRSPPSHFNCRSRIIPYFNKIPGDRDYTKDFDQDTINKAFKTSDDFRNKYWSRFPRTRSSAVLQRHYLPTVDIDTIRNGLTKLIDTKSITGIEHDRLKHLKAVLRRRVVERDSSIVIDAFGKSLLLDVSDRASIRDALEKLIVLERLDLARKVEFFPKWQEISKGTKKREIEELQRIIGTHERTLEELPF